MCLSIQRRGDDPRSGKFREIGAKFSEPVVELRSIFVGWIQVKIVVSPL
jgi:hypothetical protein